MRPSALRRTTAVLLTAGLLLASAGCGGDSDTATDEPTTEPSAAETSASTATGEATSEAPEGPDCATVWVEGEKLDQAYAGCVDGDSLVAADKVSCSSGQAFILYSDRFWAVKGGTIKFAPNGLTKSKAYRQDIAVCRG